MTSEAEMQEAWANFFHSLTPDQHSLLTHASTASAATTPESSSGINSPTMTEDHLARSYIATDYQQIHDAMQATRPASRRVRTGHAKKRPLNAFMAFRSYYSPQLSGMTQKVKSGIMQSLWSAETRKNLWAILAKAYTDIRDNHQEHVSLDKFLLATVHEIPVIPAPVYLAKMGWELTMDAYGEKIIRRADSFDINALNAEYPIDTNVSVVDLVNHCYKAHLVHRSTRVGRTAAVTFAAAAATTAAQTQSTVARDDRIFDFDMEVREVMSANNEPAAANNEPVTMSPPTFDVDIRAEYGPSINDVTADQQHAFAQVPFAMHFHPQVQPPVLGFDPGMIQDDFDPFSLDAHLDAQLEAEIEALMNFDD
ncbi:hypothetical protein DV735_g1008, partial [Chaetothyriales sp. CBS 134920]